jgi:tRNA threonylcarbamoyladenosine biosynthesis protein TsaB
MKILALEFSAQLRSVGIANVDPNGHTHLLASAEDADFRGVTGLMLIDRALSQSRLTAPAITHIAVGLGPGSYTGIRAAIAIAQGWQLGRNVQLIGISSIEVLAQQGRKAGLQGPASIIVDAQREEVYLARYDLQPGSLSVTTPLSIVKPNFVDQSDPLIGPDVNRFFPNAPKAHAISPSAAMLAELGATSKCIFSGEHLEPIYLRATTFVKAAPARTLT